MVLLSETPPELIHSQRTTLALFHVCVIVNKLPLQKGIDPIRGIHADNSRRNSWQSTSGLNCCVKYCSSSRLELFNWNILREQLEETHWIWGVRLYNTRSMICFENVVATLTTMSEHSAIFQTQKLATNLATVLKFGDSDVKAWIDLKADTHYRIIWLIFLLLPVPLLLVYTKVMLY